MQRPKLRPQSPAEAILARLAAAFPGLVDENCARAKKIGPADDGKVTEFIKTEFQRIFYTAPDSGQGVYGRLSKLFKDRAENGSPECPQAKA